MSDSTFIIGIISIIITAPFLVFVSWILFRKSVLFTIILAFAVPLDACALVGFIMGTKGLIHLTWCIPLVFGIVLFAINYLKNVIIKPVEEIRNTAASLYEGNTSVTINSKYLKGSNEISKATHMLDKLTGSLKNLVMFTKQIGHGNFSVERQMNSDTDEITLTLLAMRDSLKTAEEEKKKRQEEDERRNWVTVGLAKFADLLRANNDNIEELCNNIISNMVKYLGANQAGIFILNDEDPNNPILELKACYAYERRKYLHKTLQLSEGLVGTCFLEGQSIYMTEIPEDYIHITSGLGDGSPRSLLIVPLKLNGEKYGVIEIASFKEIQSHQKEFVEKVAESIASTIGSVKTNIQTNKLLSQSRLQAEEMANQEEELRQNMEEMQATQEEMRRREIEQSETMQRMKELQQSSEDKEFEMWQLQQAILKTFNALEFSSEGIVEFVGNRILEVSGLPESAFIGHTFYETYPDGMEEGREVWKKLTKGEQVSVNTKLNQTAMRLEFLPVFNRQRQLQRITTLVIEL